MSNSRYLKKTSYDAHGNILSMPHMSTIEWDYANRMRKSICGSTTTYYIYDYSGQRTRKITEKAGGIVEKRNYLGSYEVYRKTISGTLDFERQTLHVDDGTKQFLHIETKTVEGGKVLKSVSSVQRYQYDNHLGSACLELSSTAAIISYEEYHPFGTTSYRSGVSEAEVSLKRYKYVGKERDEETGLYYYGARYYAAWLCRFVSVDPLQHKYPYYTPYQYAGNKPISYIDLDGLEPADKIEKMPGKQINSIPLNQTSSNIVIPKKSNTNFYIGVGDVQAEIDIKDIAGVGAKYLEFAPDGGVSFTKEFNDLKQNKKDMLLAKNEGLKLISDLTKATYNDNGTIKDARILYQTEGNFNFSGYLEGGGMPDKDWATHFKGEVSDLKNVKQFSYNASITKYGVDTNGVMQKTILPKSGYQGQICIAPGSPIEEKIIKQKMVRDNGSGGLNTVDEYHKESSDVRLEMIKHELRENLFRTQGGLSYVDAHKATIGLYGIKGAEVNIFKWLK